MPLRVSVWTGLSAVALALMFGGAWLLTLPPASAVVSPSPIAEEETDAALAALQPPKRVRPLIVVLGANDGTEMTDYLMPIGILRRADVADVVALAMEPGPIELYPALRALPDATAAEFDARHPDGADYVIVPAMRDRDDPAVLAWIRSQAEKGATVIGVCVGALVVGNSGLLDGKRATTHWYYVKRLRDAHSTIRYVPDRRMVVDRGVATSTGITASMPMSLTLVEAVAGREKALAIARRLGLEVWDARHASDAFVLTRPFALTAIANTLAFWKRERLGIELRLGVDEVSLALAMDAWSRTFRSRAKAFAPSGEPVTSLSGVRIVPDVVAAGWPGARLLELGTRPPVAALDDALRAIAARYGSRTADFVAVQLEYPRSIAPE